MKVGEIRPWGSTLCGFGLETPHCDQLATTHFMLPDGMCLQACDEHCALIAGQVAEHVFIAGACGEAGTWWFTPEDEAIASRCHFGDTPSRRTPEAIESWLAAE